MSFDYDWEREIPDSEKYYDAMRFTFIPNAEEFYESMKEVHLPIIETSLRNIDCLLMQIRNILAFIAVIISFKFYW